MSIKFVCDGCGANAMPSFDSVPSQLVKRPGKDSGLASGFLEIPKGWMSSVRPNGSAYHACCEECRLTVDARTAEGKI